MRQAWDCWLTVGTPVASTSACPSEFCTARMRLTCPGSGARKELRLSALDVGNGFACNAAASHVNRAFPTAPNQCYVYMW